MSGKVDKPSRHGGVWSWRKWHLFEAAQQGQLELFVGHRSIDPGIAERKRLKKRRKRQAEQPGWNLRD
jgi:hypothetical protein